MDAKGFLWQVKRVNGQQKKKMDGGDTKRMDGKGLNEDILLARNEGRRMIHLFAPV